MAKVNRGKRLRMMSENEYRAYLQIQIIRNSKKDDVSDCVIWTGTKQTNGYGGTRMYGKVTPAHRAAYFAFKGEIPDGVEVCHSCDVRDCVNPDHLYLADHATNMEDMSKRGRGRNGIMSGAYIAIRDDGGRFFANELSRSS